MLLEARAAVKGAPVTMLPKVSVAPTPTLPYGSKMVRFQNCGV